MFVIIWDFRDITQIFGTELLDTKDYTIPVRVMDYNAQELRRQIKDLGQKNRLEKNISSVG